jgi:hypothetical protein
MYQSELSYCPCPETTSTTKHPSGFYFPSQNHKDTVPAWIIEEKMKIMMTIILYYLPPTILNTIALPWFGTRHRDQ